MAGWPLSAAPRPPFGAHHEDDRAGCGERDLPGVNPEERRTTNTHGQSRGDDETGERPLHRAPAYLAVDVTGKLVHSRLGWRLPISVYGAVQS